MKIKLFFAFALFSILLISCREDNNPVENDEQIISTGFSDARVGEIFEENCTTSGCHGGTNPANGLSLETHGNLLLGSSSRKVGETSNGGGAVVVPYEPEKSLLYRMISGETTPVMPLGRNLLDAADVEIIKTWIEQGARDENDVVPELSGTDDVYVCSQNADYINVIDGELKNVLRTISTDFIAENDAPHMVKYSDGFIYATTIKSGKLLKINGSNFQIVTAVEGLGYPGMIQIDGSAGLAYVSRSSTAPGTYSTIYKIDINNMELLEEIVLPVEGIPHGIALTADGSKLYVANLTKNRVSVVNTSNGELITDVSLDSETDHQPMQAALSPDDKYLYISARGSGKLLVLDTDNMEVISSVGIGMGPMHIATSSDGSKIYLPAMMAGTVSVVDFDGSNWTKTNEISHPAMKMPHGCDITSDDRYLYVSCRNTEGMYSSPYPYADGTRPGLLFTIDLGTESVLKYQEIGAYGSGLTIRK
ncbi:MAG: hypothetical protein SCALA702_12180 [Melioribacteraceae bacterium]|nr:MAG: hypothetical protein SCALA702_12180 [Melioribacteraceae bacterium]